jgi:hypothetical protein
VLNDSLILIPFDEENEAHYISSILNSSPVLFTIASYTYELRMETHITKNIHIPQFDPANKLHLKLSELSKKAHELARQIYEEGREDLRAELAEVEEEIDHTVSELYGITDEELKEIKKTLKILKEGEEEEEEESEEEEVLPAKKPIEIKVEPLLIDEKQATPIQVTIINNLDTHIKNLNVEISLAGNVFTAEIEQIKKGESHAVASFNTPELGSGQYEVLVRVNYEIKGHEEFIEEKRTLFVKPKRKIRGEGSMDKELEELLR